MIGANKYFWIHQMDKSSIYFPLTSIYIYMYGKIKTEAKKKQTTETGVNQKDLQIDVLVMIEKQEKRAL